jgi:peptidoglycan/xylan/chitin deacetylase (PgdA/CDA1 family)
MSASVNSLPALRQRVINKWRRLSVDHLGRRPLRLPPGTSYVSFTFDDFPVSALSEGGRILAENGVRGTYFVSLGLLGQPSPSGPIATVDHLHTAVKDGHELGCHTHDHLDGTQTTPEEFTRSIEANRAALTRHALGVEFDVFAYPLNGPALSVKRAVSPHFVACRGGGQTFNRDGMDLNLLKAHFLDRRQSPDFDAVARMIEMNAAAGGWLIFATHDIAPKPSVYGCDLKYFESTVRRAVSSGANILPMGEVCRHVGNLPARVVANI